MPFTDAYKNKILNLVFNNTTFTPPTNIFVGLYNIVPTETTPGSEISDTAYLRQPATFNTVGIVSTALNLVYPQATIDWGVVTGYGLFETQTNGTAFFYDTFPSVYLVELSNNYVIDEIDITFDVI